MYTAKQVDAMITGWVQRGDDKKTLAKEIAEACLGWSYVFGARGEYCTPANRRSYADRSTCPEVEANSIRKKCQVLNGSKSACTGCTYYPNGQTRVYDCRGFTYWVFKQLGIIINGSGATSQYRNDENWSIKGTIDGMPSDCVCCVFKDVNGVKEHTGLYVGDGKIIHCSGTVKAGKITDKGWTHYAIPKGMDGGTTLPVLRRGDRGEYVVKAQKLLKDLGYDIGSMGADGIFGARTEAAVKDFQRDWGLTQDGVIGKNTWERLTSAPVRDKFYTAVIKHLDKAQAEAVKTAYPNCTIEEE